MKDQHEIEKTLLETDVRVDATGDRQMLDEILDVHRNARAGRGPVILAALSPLRLAAAAVLIAVGFFAARAMSPEPVDVGQLEASLRVALQRDIAEAVSGSDSSVTDVTQVSNAVRLQLQSDMPKIIEQILAASQAQTDQRMLEMAQLIEEARLQDRRRVEAALQRIEANRLADRSRMGQGLLRLAAMGDNGEY